MRCASMLVLVAACGRAGFETRTGDALDLSGASAVLRQSIPVNFVSQSTVTGTINSINGNLLIAAVYWNYNGATVTVTDTIGSTWRNLTQYDNLKPSNAATGLQAQFWYVESAVPGANTVTVTQTLGTNPIGFYLLEYEGMVAGDVVDTVSGHDGVIATNAMDTPALTTTWPKTLIVALFSDPVGVGAMDPGPGYVEHGRDIGFYTMVEDNGAGVETGTYTPTATMPVGQSNEFWVSTAAAFKIRIP